MAENENLAGDWPVAYVKHKWGYSKNQAEQIGVMVLVLDGPLKGRRYVWYGSWSEAALPMTVEGLMARGWFGQSLTTLKADLKEGAEAVGAFGYEEYEGRQRLRLNFINPAKQIRFAKDMTPEGFKPLADRVHRMIDQGKHLRKDRRADAPDSDDDIPF